MVETCSCGICREAAVSVRYCLTGSRKMFTLGVQKVCPACPALANALPSVPMALPTCSRHKYQYRHHKT